MISTRNVHVDTVFKTPQFWLMWTTFGTLAASGMALLFVAKTMMYVRGRGRREGEGGRKMRRREREGWLRWTTFGTLAASGMALLFVDGRGRGREGERERERGEGRRWKGKEKKGEVY
jgi:hypothetical protein